MFAEAAARLDDWHLGGTNGPRPRGRLRRHDPKRVSRVSRLWVEPLVRWVVDPDGRPDRARRHNLI
jgi:hypothetical protein